MKDIKPEKHGTLLVLRIRRSDYFEAHVHVFHVPENCVREPIY